MGITFLAAGTSVPDCMASLIVARQGIHKNRQKAPSKGGGVVEMTVIAMDEASQRPDDCWIIVFFFLPPLPFCPCGVAVKECGVAERRQLDEISSLILSSVFILSLVIKYLNSAVCLSLATAALQSSILCFVAAGASPLWLWDVNPTHSSTDLACTILPIPPPATPVRSFLSPTHFSFPCCVRVPFFSSGSLCFFCFITPSLSFCLGMGDMAVSNSIGSNVFDILVGLGLPWALKTLAINYGSDVRTLKNVHVK